MADKNDELIEVCTEDGSFTGVAKTRKEIHSVGDWHRIGDSHILPLLTCYAIFDVFYFLVQCTYGVWILTQERWSFRGVRLTNWQTQTAGIPRVVDTLKLEKQASKLVSPILCFEVQLTKSSLWWTFVIVIIIIIFLWLATKELKEEIGIDVLPEQLIFLGSYPFSQVFQDGKSIWWISGGVIINCLKL